MARIQDLPAASQIFDTDLFVLLQGGEDKNLSGEALKQYIAGHGGIASVEYDETNFTLTLTFTDGETYTTGSIRGREGVPGANGFSPTVNVTEGAGGWNVTITDADGPHSFFIRNGTGSGDMLASVYDPNGDVAAASGIPAFVNGVAGTKLNTSGGTINGNLRVNGNMTVYGNTVVTQNNLPTNLPASFVTTAPTAANTVGLKFAVLNYEPATKYSGWVYLITEA